MLTDAEYIARRRWNQIGLGVVLALLVLGSLNGLCAIVQPPRTTANIEFDISPKGEFLITATDGIQDGEIGLGLGKPRHIGTGYGAIFGRTPDEIIYSGYVRRGERAIFAFKVGEEPKRITHPPTGAQDYDCALSRDGRKLFFLRSLLPRTTSMGGLALDAIDLWVLDFDTGIERELTQLSMFRADLGPRAATADTAAFVGWPRGAKTARLLRVSTRGEIRDVIGNPAAGSGFDLGGCTLDESAANVYFTTGAFPSKLYSVPLAGGKANPAGEDKSMWRPLIRGSYVYYQAPVLTGQGIKRLDIRNGSSSIVTSLAP